MAKQQSSQTGSPRPNQAPGGGRTAGVKFVVLFLVFTGVFLVAYNMSTNTRFMNWYLFQVGQHTAALLRLGGHSCTVERGEDLLGRERYVREATAAWAKGEDAPAMQATGDQSGPPLTSWEVYRYRHGLRAALANEYEKRIAALTKTDKLTITSLDQLKGYIRERLDRLEQGLGKPGQLLPPDTATMARFLSVKDRFARMSESLPTNAEQTSNDLQALLTEIEQIGQEAVASLQNAQARSGDAIGMSGPLVEFVAKVSPATRLREIRTDIRRVEKDASLSEEMRSQKLDALRVEREALEKSLPESAVLAPPQGTDAEVIGTFYSDEDRFFRFRVVPDCGALSAMAIFVAGVLAFPAGFGRRIAGLLIGLPILYVINLLRLAVLGILGAYDKSGQIFDFVHHYVWQGIYIIFVVAVWLLWVELIVQRRPECKEKTA